MRKVISVDRKRLPTEQDEAVIVNRWHPDIPMVAEVKPGETCRVESCDGTGGPTNNADAATHTRHGNPAPRHHLSGPVGVTGAGPGDIIVVDILDIGVFDDERWGYTGIFSKQKFGGFLTDYFPKTAKAVWDFNGIFATSRHIPN